MENENTNHPDEDKKSLKDDFNDSATPDGMLDDSKAKFLPLNGGTDPSVVIEVGSDRTDVSFTGLGKEDLMQFAKDPFWIRIRMILLITFWVGWLAMLGTAIAIIALAPRCPERRDMKWFESDVVYQIFPKSFQDTTTDSTDAAAGVGDLAGIAKRIDYLQDIGVNAFWINSIYESGSELDGDDLTDHGKINPIFGYQEDFNSLRKSTKKKGMKMMLDFIPNHTGRKHMWFTKSQAKDSEYADFYIWADGTGADKKSPPNQWENKFGKPAWTYDDTRQQFYYHSSLPEYPDLNLRNDAVLSKLDGILRQWLDAGVDGFFVKDVEYLVEHNDTSKGAATDGAEFTKNQEENLGIIGRWRNIINTYSDKPGREKVLMAAVKDDDKNTTLKYFEAGIQVMPTQALVGADNLCDGDCLKMRLEEAVAINQWRGWMVDNDETMRFGSSVRASMQKVFQALQLLLPGTAMVYYGDEIGMKEGVVTAAKDPLASEGMSRDSHRTPMLWTNSPNAGFCRNDITPWLPVNDGYRSSSVEYNNAHFVGYTLLDSFKDLVSLRTSSESLQFGKLEMGVMNNKVLYFTRKATGFPGFLVAINLASDTSAYNFGSVADSVSLVYHSEKKLTDAGKVFDIKSNPIGFQKMGEVFVFTF